jgi:hypothetical protein
MPVSNEDKDPCAKHGAVLRPQVFDPYWIETLREGCNPDHAKSGPIRIPEKPED